MKNSLQNLIREAFNTAYKTHKTKKLNESAEEFKLNTQEKALADEKLNALINKGPGYENITWAPNESGGLSQKQQNYIIEKLFELYKATRDQKYKNAIAQMYPYGSSYKDGKFDKSPLFKLANSRYGSTTALERLREKNPDALENFLGDIWLRIFGGGKLVGGKSEGKDMFDSIVDNYKFTGPGFGAYLAKNIINQVPNEIQNATTKSSEFSAGVTSLDKPLDATGKTRDIGGKESDEERRNREKEEREERENRDREKEEAPIEDLEGDEQDPDSDLDSDLDPDSEGELDPEGDLAKHGTTGEMSDEPEDIAEPEIGGYEEKHASEKTKRALSTVQLFIKLINQAIDSARAQGVYDKQPLFFDMLGWMVNDFMNYDEMQSKYPDRFLDKGGKPFSPASYFSSVIKKDLGKSASFVDTFLDLKWPSSQGIAPDFFCGGRGNCSEFQPSNFFKAAKLARAAGMLEEQELQKFLSENLDKIMDRVYKRLSKGLNG